MNYFVAPDIWVERKKKSVKYFKETTRVEWFEANWALKIIIFRYFAFFLELIDLLFFTVFSFYICFVHDFFRVRTCVPCVQVATPLIYVIINRPYDLKPLRKQFFCPIKQLRKHATVAFGKKIPFVLIFKGLHMSLWVPHFLVKAELRFYVTKAN